MKKNLYYINFIIFLAICLLSLNSFGYSSKSKVCSDAIVAIINDEIITLHEVNIMLAPLYLQLKDTVSSRQELNDKLEEARGDILKKLIEERLLVQQAEKLKIEVKSHEIDAHLNSVIDRFASKKEFESALAEQGVTIDDIRKRYRDQILVSKIVEQQVKSRVYIGPSEIYRYYEQNKDKYSMNEKIHLFNILIRFKQGEDISIAQEKVRGIMNLIRSGSSFQNLARKYSQGPNAEKGGDMGFIQKGDIIEAIDKIAFDLKPGQVAGPIKTDLGYHIIQIKEKQSSTVKPLAEVSRQIHVELYQKKAEVAYNKFIKKLKDDAYISTR